MVAGLNAGLHALRRPAYRFDRSQSMIGVLVEDITGAGITEPYRMFTSRAEHRMHIRPDNAYERLGTDASRLGALWPAFEAEIDRRKEAFRKGLLWLGSTRCVLSELVCPN